MRSRLVFIVITLFWLTMNFLLWRSEFSSHKRAGSAVPINVVVDKILTAPDLSSLEVYHRGQKIGFCRLAASVGAQGNHVLSEDFQPEGMVEQPASYNLDFEGNVTPIGTTNRVRFELNVKISTNKVWQEFSLRANRRPDSWEIHSSAVDETVRFAIEGEDDSWEQSFTFEQLRNPQLLLRDLGGPMALALLGNLGNLGVIGGSKTNSASLMPSLKWEANEDQMRFGHSKVRVYRLHTKLFGRYEIFVFVSRVGEILWVELPDQIVLSNDAFTHF